MSRRLKRKRGGVLRYRPIYGHGKGGRVQRVTRADIARTKRANRRGSRQHTPRSIEISANIRKGKRYAKIQRKFGYIPSNFLS